MNSLHRVKLVLFLFVFCILWLNVYFRFIIKVPFYIYMNTLALPESCRQLETKVILTDFDGEQVVAERLVYSTDTTEYIKKYIDENNKYSKRIVAEHFFFWNNREYDHDILIPTKKYPYDPKDSENYVLLHYASLYKGGRLYEIMVLIGMIVMLLTCFVVWRKFHHK